MPSLQGVEHMADVSYLLLTIGFFAAMFVYVRGCDRLGRSSDRDTSS
jgi:hypothetical protein